MIKNFLHGLFKKYFGVEESKNRELGTPKKILIVRQHNQFGDMLASVSLFRAVKEKYPDSKLSVIASPQNFYAITKNQYIDETIIFEKNRIFNRSYYKKLKKFINSGFDLAIVPATVSISFTSNLIAAMSDAKIKIGPESLDGKDNKSKYLFNKRVKLDWRKNPDAHISDFGQDILRPFGIHTWDFSSKIDFDKSDKKVAEDFIAITEKNEKDFLIGFHVGAGKPKNRWSLDKYCEVINELNNKYDSKIFLTGSDADINEINYIKANCDVKVFEFLNHSIPELAAIISKADLFITNDTGVMHVAGTTPVKQISIFGPTNPFNWAPIGSGKYFLRKSDFIDDIQISDVLELAVLLLGNKKVNQ